MVMFAAIDWTQGLQEAWDRVAAFVPKLLGFFVILLIGYFVARIVAAVVGRVLGAIGLDKWVERGGLRQMLSGMRYDPSQILVKITYYAIMLLALQLAFGVFGPNPISDLIEGIVAFLPRLFAAVVILVIAAAFAAAARDLLTGVVGGLSYGPLLTQVAAASILVVGVFAALSQLRVAAPIVTGLFYGLLATVAGIAIVAVGGSGIAPLRRKWEQTLKRLEKEPLVRMPESPTATPAGRPSSAGS